MEHGEYISKPIAATQPSGTEGSKLSRAYDTLTVRFSQCFEIQGVNLWIIFYNRFIPLLSVNLIGL
jgi:hypothetical protein